MTRQMNDAKLVKSFALPNGAVTVNSTGIDLGHDALGDFLAGAEVIINAPALTVGELADTQTITYSLRHSDAADFSGDSELLGGLIVQTGAGGAGAAAAEKRVALPTDVKRYIRTRAVKAGASNASTANGSMKMVF